LRELPDPGRDATTDSSFSGSGHRVFFRASWFFLRLLHLCAFAVRAFAAARGAFIAISRRRFFVRASARALPPIRPVRACSRFIAGVSFFTPCHPTAPFSILPEKSYTISGR